MKYLLLILTICCSSFMLISCKGKEKTATAKAVSTVDTTQLLERIVFGSCNKQWLDQSYWKIIENEQADLWIWMGDIIYSDTEDMDALKLQYDIQKGHEEYVDFSDSIDILGIYDDHDYGVNDGGASYPKRLESRDLLFDFLDIPEASKERLHEGAYQSYLYGPENRKVKILLLDGRYFRDELQSDVETNHRYLPNENGTYLGKEQWQWLENEIQDSEAALNLIVSGIQVIPTQHYFEKWSNFPNERKRLFELLDKNEKTNTVFLSGDRHVAEFMHMEWEGVNYYELTSSGMTHSYEKADEENQYRISPLISSKNYGQLVLDWEEDVLKVNFQIHHIDGSLLYEYMVVYEL